jgi:hypothetical protein
MVFFEEPLPGAVSEPTTRQAALRIPNLLTVAPNPIANQARISFGLDRALPATVRVYDARGRLVTELASGNMAAGNHNLLWDLRDVSGHPVAKGVYYCALSASFGSRTAKLLVTR